MAYKHGVSAIIIAFFISTLTFAQTDTTSEVIHTKTGKIVIEKLAKFNEPWGMTFLPDGRLLVTEKPGTLRIYSNGSVSAAINGVPEVAYRGQGGLMDVEIDPNFSANSLVYIYYVEAAEKQPQGARDPGDKRFGGYNDPEDILLKGGAVARGRLDGNTLRDVKVIWRQYPKMIGRGHFGGRLIFGQDGKLYITSGDRMYFDPAQHLNGNLGKIVRINSDGSIPSDNPYVRRPGARSDIWSLGHRNPLGGAIHPKTKKLWIHEMGPLQGDELNIPERGRNYGWPLASNGNNYDGSNIPDHAAKPQFAAPTFYWHPAVSPSGMIFYTGNNFKDWNGNILMGGLSSEALIRVQVDDKSVKGVEQINLHRRIRDVIQAPDGSVWLLTDYKEGELLRVRAGKD